MAELALAPLPWQQASWQQLAERQSQQKLPHALLLHGAEGVGKRHLARLLALSLLCEMPQQALPCGQCHGCRLFAAGSHPDFFLADTSWGLREAAEDDGESKTRKSSKKSALPGKQIKIDCIRELIHFGTQTAHQGGRRVALVEPAEALNHNAANALLKTLEEPGEGLFILLISHQPSRLLPTLRSRCQSVFLNTPSHEQALGWLRHHIAAERAETALAFCQGAPLKAQAAVHAELDLAHREVLLTLQACRAGEVTYLFAAETLAKHDAVMVLDWWLGLVHRQMCTEPAMKIARLYDNLLAARRRAQSTANPNIRMLFETLLIDYLVD